MKSIQKIVDDGICSQSDLHEALYCAMRLEFATIPPYLCAQWSISEGDVDGYVSDLLKMIVVQEMYHFSLAGNMLSSLGVVPAIDNAGFLQSYPTNDLPGGIAMILPVDLKPLTRDQVAVFIQIESPQFPPIANLALDATRPLPATIGEFYDAIKQAFADLSKILIFDPNAPFVTGFGGETFPITNCQDAIRAIEQIKMEGEGTPMSPIQRFGGKLAHFYRFQELYDGMTRPDDPQNPNQPIAFPSSTPFERSKNRPSDSLKFSRTFTEFMVEMKKSWTGAVRPDISAMRNLEKLGRQLIKSGIQPEFVWVS